MTALPTKGALFECPIDMPKHSPEQKGVHSKSADLSDIISPMSWYESF